MIRALTTAESDRERERELNKDFRHRPLYSSLILTDVSLTACTMASFPQIPHMTSFLVVAKSANGIVSRPLIFVSSATS